MSAMNDHAKSSTEGHRYFTRVPNVIFSLGLSAHVIALYTVIRRTAGDDGKCTKGTARLAKEACMSTGMVSKAKKQLLLPRNELGGRPLISIQKVPVRGKMPADHITVTDIWAVNEMTRGGNDREAMAALLPKDAQAVAQAGAQAEFKPTQTQNRADSVHPVNNPVHPMNGSRSPDEIKKIPSEEEPNEEKHRQTHPLGARARACSVSSRRCTVEEAWAYAHAHGLPLTHQSVDHWQASMEFHEWQLPVKEGDGFEPVRDWRAALRSSVTWLNDARNGVYRKPGTGPPRPPIAKGAEAELDQWVKTIVDAYPARGNRSIAEKAVRKLLKDGLKDRRELLEKVWRHGARWRALSWEQRRWCPALHTYFSNKRWTDNPDRHPWVVDPERRASPYR